MYKCADRCFVTLRNGRLLTHSEKICCCDLLKCPVSKLKHVCAEDLAVISGLPHEQVIILTIISPLSSVLAQPAMYQNSLLEFCAALCNCDKLPEDSVRLLSSSSHSSPSPSPSSSSSPLLLLLLLLLFCSLASGTLKVTILFGVLVMLVFSHGTSNCIATGHRQSLGGSFSQWTPILFGVLVMLVFSHDRTSSGHWHRWEFQPLDTDRA